MNDLGPQRTPRRWLSVLGTTVACLAVLAASAAAIVVINRTEPQAEQIEATRKSSALVETLTVRRSTYSPRLVVLGSVEPAQDIVLSPRVEGQVLEMSAKFVPGGMVQAGDTLLQIDRADFENALLISESQLSQAEASLEIEQGRQSLAAKELSLLGDTIDEIDRSLVLRAPQFASIKAEVSAAEAAVQRAQLDLQRTQVVAPFDAQVLQRSVNVGSQVRPGDELGQLVGVDEYWVFAAVPVRSLRWVQFSESGDAGSAVTLRHPDTWGPETSRAARVTRMIGTLDQQSRLARVLITVKDPLGLESGDPPLILNTLLQAQIEGRPIDDVVKLQREYVRDRDTVWVMKDEKLEIRETEILFRDAAHAYIRSGLENGDEVVISTLATVADGVGLRKIEAEPEAEAESESETEAEAESESETEAEAESKTGAAAASEAGEGAAPTAAEQDRDGREAGP